MPFYKFLQIFIGFVLFVEGARAQDFRPQPEISTGLNAVSESQKSQDYMIVTAHPLATQAGRDILARGGTAADAAVAAQLVLGLVEPQSSGLGGGAFVLYYDASQQKLHSYDARETAPALSGPFQFTKRGASMDFQVARLSGLSTGVPGVPMLLHNLHEKHGVQTWMELFEAPKALANGGFPLTARLHEMLNAHAPDLNTSAQAMTLYMDGHGKPQEIGSVIQNIPYYNTLKDYAFYGPQVFYQGNIAKSIEQAVQNDPRGAGLITPRDMRSYTVKTRAPVCGPYRRYIVCSMGEPSSGGLTLLQILALLEGYDLRNFGLESEKSWSLIAQASALAFADRNLYMADPDFVNTPGVLLLDPQYIAQRRALITLAPDVSGKAVQAGQPPLWDGPLYAKGVEGDMPGTTHISIIDSYGNALSMTSSIESAFGTHMMVGGFFLNNQLTDFSFMPVNDQKALVANMVEGGKRPRSSMSPVIVFDQQKNPVLIVGSAGGSRIIGYVLQRLIAVLDWDMELQAAVNMPHILARGPTIEIEKSATLQPSLEALGHTVESRDLNSGLTAIYVTGDTITGAADPRREGVALGK